MIRVVLRPLRRISQGSAFQRGVQWNWERNAGTDDSKPAAQLASNEELMAIVRQFPPGIDYSFGYGSGVLRQQPLSSQSSNSRGMVDIILAVNDPFAWHSHNLRCHPDHYSLVARVGGPQFVTWLQTNFGAKLYFHPFVEIDINAGSSKSSGRSSLMEIKYGVVSTDDLIKDLVHWEHLYLAGRMHKPIVSIGSVSADEEQTDSTQTNERSDEIEEAQRTNLLSAVSASLLLHAPNNQQPPSLELIETSQLYNTIASLSYTGDFRMKAGAEDPDKVRKLVETPGMLELWEEKYSDTLDLMNKAGLLSVNADEQIIPSKQLEINLTDAAVRKHLVENLPPRLRKHADSIICSDGDSDSIMQASVVLREELAKIVSPAAKSQGLKGVFTAGVWKSWKYALAKFAKGRLKK